MQINYGLLLQLIIACLGAYIVAFTASLVMWTFRDIRSRSRDIFAQFGPFMQPRQDIGQRGDRCHGHGEIPAQFLGRGELSPAALLPIQSN